MTTRDTTTFCASTPLLPRHPTYTTSATFSALPTMTSSSTPRPLSTDAKLQNVQQLANNVTDVLRNNIEIAIDRGEKIEEMEQSSIRLEENAQRFRKSAKELKCQAWKKKAKLSAIILLILACIIILIYFLVKAKS